jgi:hypothetical protein
VDRGYLTQTEIQTLMNAPMKNATHELVRWKIQCKLPPKTKRFCPLVLK